MHDVMGQTRGQRVARGVVAVSGVALPYLYVKWINHSSQVFSDATKGWLIATAAVLTAACVAFAYHFLIEGPYQLWNQHNQESAGKDYLNDALARRKAEAIAETFYPRRAVEAPRRDDGFRRHLEHLAAEAAKRCPETPIWKAVKYVRAAIGDDDFHNCYPDVRAQIRQAAVEDRLEVWGRREVLPAHMSAPQGASTAWTKIEPEYWKTHEIASQAISEQSENQPHTWVEGQIVKIGDRYWSLKVRQAQVERLWHPQKEAPQADLVDKANRRALIASGRDIVQEYRNGGLAEPFGAFAVKHRAYLDIQPHFGDEYVREAMKRAEVNDTPQRRDYAAAMFLRELARLEKEWKL